MIKRTLPGACWLCALSAIALVYHVAAHEWLAVMPCALLTLEYASQAYDLSR
ncbi:MAG: hypothetical protein AAFU38_05795 [Bacteroidota bacterium]